MSRRIGGLVQAGGVETPYLRAGQGLPVLLLGSHSLAEAERNPLFLRLAGELRIIAPVRAREAGPAHRGRESQGGFDTWLRNLTEALGLERPCLLGPAHFSPALAQLLETQTQRLACVALIGYGEEAGIDEKVGGPVRLPILELRHRSPTLMAGDEVMMGALVSFLSRASAPG